MEGGPEHRDPTTSNQIGNAKIWWHWTKYNNEPWAEFWKSKYALDHNKQNIIRFYSNIKGSHIWNSAYANHKIVQTLSF